jgi:hypothetical protein
MRMRPPRTPAKARRASKSSPPLTGTRSGPPRKRSPTWPLPVAVKTSRSSSSRFADLSQIQNRTGDRKAAVEMAFEPDQNDRRAEVKRFFRQLQRIRSIEAEPAEPERVVNLCRQAAQSLEPQLRTYNGVQSRRRRNRSTRNSARRPPSGRRRSRGMKASIRITNASRAEAWATARACRGQRG